MIWGLMLFLGIGYGFGYFAGRDAERALKTSRLDAAIRLLDAVTKAQPDEPEERFDWESAGL